MIRIIQPSRCVLWLTVCLFFGFNMAYAQKTTIFTEANRAFKKGEQLYKDGVFGMAQKEYQRALNLLQPTNEPEYELLQTQAELGYAKCRVRLEAPDGEVLISNFIRKYSPDPIANMALIELADYYYNARKYDEALDYYARIPSYALNKKQRSEVLFKAGYSYFVKQDFKKAKANFDKIKDETDSDYYYPTNYYLGLCAFFDGDYDQAIRKFKMVENYGSYKSYIPYYLCQIYFAERNYDELIRYGEAKLNQGGIKKTLEIEQMIGQAYFEKEEYQKALPHLENYSNGSNRMREEEFYQLGITQLRTGNYQKAVYNFEQLINVDSKLGQSALYNLGDLYLKTNQKNSARNAFGKASRMPYDVLIQEESLFNYAKLSYELKYDQEALAALQYIKPGMKYYNEAQALMSNVFLNTRDYEKALTILEGINRTPQLNETYQKVAFLRGLQLYKAKDSERAKVFFNKSLQVPIDPSTKAQALFWLGDIAHNAKDYNRSQQYLSQFISQASSLNNLPDEASLFTANYIQGYNYLKQDNYGTAQGYFQDAVAGITRNKNLIRNAYVKNQVLGDATVRAGDCYFKRNQYNEAVKFYDEAVNRRYPGYIYALYQKAIIEGLRGNTTEKILALEQLHKNFPKSEYADDALLQLGLTYQEIGKFQQAKAPLNTLVNQYSGKSPLVNQALLRLGLIAYNQNQTQQAINYYKQIFQNNPEPSEANTALAALEEIYVNDLGQPDQYFAFLETIPGYKVDNFAKDSINFRAAEAQFENGNYEKAVTAYTNYLRKFPKGANSLIAYFHRGESYSVLKQYSNALNDYEQVVNSGPSKYYEKALNKAALIAYNHEEDFQKSYQLYSKLETAASSEEMRFEAQLGGLRSAYRIGNKQAVYDLAGKVANNPNATTEQAAAATFYRAKISYDQKDYPNALTGFQRVVQTSDNELTAEARYLIAHIRYLQRELEVAKQLCINANKESSSYPYWVAKSVLLLADIFAEQNDLFNAKAALEALIENYDGDQELVNTAKQKLVLVNQQLNAESRIKRDDPNNLLEMDDTGN